MEVVASAISIQSTSHSTEESSKQCSTLHSLPQFKLSLSISLALFNSRTLRKVSIATEVSFFSRICLFTSIVTAHSMYASKETLSIMSLSYFLECGQSQRKMQSLWIAGMGHLVVPWSRSSFNCPNPFVTASTYFIHLFFTSSHVRPNSLAITS